MLEGTLDHEENLHRAAHLAALHECFEATARTLSGQQPKRPHPTLPPLLAPLVSASLPPASLGDASDDPLVRAANRLAALMEEVYGGEGEEGAPVLVEEKLSRDFWDSFDTPGIGEELP